MISRINRMNRMNMMGMMNMISRVYLIGRMNMIGKMNMTVLKESIERRCWPPSSNINNDTGLPYSPKSVQDSGIICVYWNPTANMTFYCFFDNLSYFFFLRQVKHFLSSYVSSYNQICPSYFTISFESVIMASVKCEMSCWCSPVLLSSVQLWQLLLLFLYPRCFCGRMSGLH